MNKKGAKESSSSIGSPKFLLCKLNSFFPYKSRKTKRDGCEKRNAFIETKTKCASNLIRKATVHLQNQSKTPSF